MSRRRALSEQEAQARPVMRNMADRLARDRPATPAIQASTTLANKCHLVIAVNLGDNGEWRSTVTIDDRFIRSETAQAPAAAIRKLLAKDVWPIIGDALRR